MSVHELKTFEVRCEFASYGKDSTCASVVGPVFARAEYDVPIPEGWKTRTLTDCGLTGYTRHDLVCPNCAKRLGL